MEIILGVNEYPPGSFVPRHIHHGEEAFYVLEGGMIEPVGQPPRMLAPGIAGINVRDVGHAGFKVVGDKSVKLLTVHVVDKGHPLFIDAK